MDILFICAEAPTVAHHRPHGLIAALARRGYSVTLIFGDEAGTVFDDLAEHCRRVLPIRRRQLAEAVQREVEGGSYDVIHVDRSARGLVPDRMPRPSVLDAAVCSSLRLERSLRTRGLLARATRGAWLPAIRREEAAVLTRYQRVLVACQDDAEALREIGGAASAGIGQSGVHVVPTPIDGERHGPPLRLRDPATLLLDLRDMSRAEASAALGAVGAALPALWEQWGDARLTVMGHVPLGKAGWLAGDPRVVFTGHIHDPRGHLSAATVVVAPVATVAPPHTTLEALATGTAVVASEALARELGATPGDELLVADAPAELARAALSILDDAPFRGRLGRQGRRLVERCHSWERALAALEDVYAAATGSAIAEWRLEVGLDQPRVAE